MSQLKYTCVNCESDKEPYFSRTEPMGFYCQDCGKNSDELDLSNAKATADYWMEKATQAEQAAADLKAEVEDWKKELADIQDRLLDPHAVFLSILHGKIAKLDWDRLEHINGPHPTREQLATERALADRLANALTNPAVYVAVEALAAWKEARGE